MKEATRRSTKTRRVLRSQYMSASFGWFELMVVGLRLSPTPPSPRPDVRRKRMWANKYYVGVFTCLVVVLICDLASRGDGCRRGQWSRNSASKAGPRLVPDRCSWGNRSRFPESVWKYCSQTQRSESTEANCDRKRTTSWVLQADGRKVHAGVL